MCVCVQEALGFLEPLDSAWLISALSKLRVRPTEAFMKTFVHTITPEVCIVCVCNLCNLHTKLSVCVVCVLCV